MIKTYANANGFKKSDWTVSFYNSIT